LTAPFAHPWRPGRPTAPPSPPPPRASATPRAHGRYRRPTAAPDQRNLAGTPLALGQGVLSVADVVNKPVDAEALALSAGQSLPVQLGAASAEAVVLLLPPGTAPFPGAPDAAHRKERRLYPLLEAGTPGMLYTVRVAATRRQWRPPGE